MNDNALDKMDKIIIRSLRLRCIIGTQAWERETLQDVQISVTLLTELAAAGRSDRIEETVDYKILTKQIIHLTENSSFFLVEALAEKIANLCLEEPKVQCAHVRVEKPGALRFAQSVGVEIRRSRENPA